MLDRAFLQIARAPSAEALPAAEVEPPGSRHNFRFATRFLFSTRPSTIGQGYGGIWVETWAAPGRPRGWLSRQGTRDPRRSPRFAL